MELITFRKVHFHMFATLRNHTFWKVILFTVLPFATLWIPYRFPFPHFHFLIPIPVSISIFPFPHFHFHLQIPFPIFICTWSHPHFHSHSHFLIPFPISISTFQNPGSFLTPFLVAPRPNLILIHLLLDPTLPYDSRTSLWLTLFWQG